ncbi:MAG: hypothetical protein ACI8ZX_001771 [Planctomycetota bacterium]|jgi:hypothetical protein
MLNDTKSLKECCKNNKQYYLLIKFGTKIELF